MESKYNPNPNPHAQWKPTGEKALSKRNMSVKLMPEVDAEVRKIAGDRLGEWLREAIAAKLEKEKLVV